MSSYLALIRVQPIFLRGDSNADGKLDISDAITTLGALFLGDPEITCEDAMDSNDDGQLDISDPIGLLGHLFLGDPSELSAPGKKCGPDLTQDALGCNSYEYCGG